MNATSSAKTLSSEGSRVAPLVHPAATPILAPAEPAPKRRRWGLMLSLPLVLAAVGAGYWLTGGRYETTENANLHRAHVSIEHG